MTDNVRVQQITDRLVQILLEMKKNRSFNEVLDELRPCFLSLAMLLHPPQYSHPLMKELVDDVDNIPGSYLLSMFLLCLDNKWELHKPDVSLQQAHKSGMHEPFPPIMLMEDTTDKKEALAIIGKAVKDLLKTGPGEVEDEVVGERILQDWDSDTINAMFIELEMDRPVIKSCQRRHEAFWNKRGLIIAKPVIKRDWFGENDISFQHGIFFPVRLLEKDFFCAPASSTEQHSAKEETTSNQVDWIKESCGSSEEEAGMEHEDWYEKEETDDEETKILNTLKGEKLRLQIEMFRVDKEIKYQLSKSKGTNQAKQRIDGTSTTRVSLGATTTQTGGLFGVARKSPKVETATHDGTADTALVNASTPETKPPCGREPVVAAAGAQSDGGVGTAAEGMISINDSTTDPPVNLLEGIPETEWDSPFD